MTKTEYLKKLGKSIGYFVEQSEQSDNLIAIHAGLGASTRLHQIINGEVNFTIYTLDNIAMSLGVTTQDILNKMGEF